MKRVSMQDVADAAGVSRMTVSFALRDSPHVSAKVKAEVRALAESMGYRLDPLLQRFAAHMRSSRRSQYSGTLAYLIGDPGMQSKFPYRVYHAAAKRRAEQLGYLLEEFWPGQKGMTGMKLSRILEHRGIEGVIFAPLRRSYGHLRLDWSKFAVAAIGYTIVRPQVHRAVNHQVHTAREAIRQLTRLRYRRIGLCIDASQNQRVDYSFEQAMALHHRRVPAGQRVPPLFMARREGGALLRWVEKEKPDCLLALGQWAYGQLIKAGYRVPEDIGVTILDLPEEETEFAGMNQRDDEVGLAAVDLVIGQLYRNERGLPDTPRTLLVEGRWRAGASVRPAGTIR